MTIQEYLRILRTRGWIIVVAALLCAAAAYGVSSFQKEFYRASVFVSTVPARADWGLANTASELMRNFAANIQTPEIAQRVIDRAQLDQNRYAFLGNLTVAPDASTFTIRIDAKASDPDVARLMALTLADELVEERTAYYAQQDKRDRIEVKIRSREIGAPQIQPKPLINSIAGGVLGTLVGIAIVLLLTWMEADLLRTPATVERTLDLPVLGAIPRSVGQKEITETIVQPQRIGAPETA
ncbi:hypothetical protein KFU94_45365 [Chloroflexi bacterium TSY]|nr:hypothetical protein [Chloroflexi bacterium TSY]